MSVVEIALTAEQLASAYLQLNEQERRPFCPRICTVEEEVLPAWDSRFRRP
jgi:hypothetical protein